MIYKFDLNMIYDLLTRLISNENCAYTVVHKKMTSLCIHTNVCGSPT